MKWNEHSRYEGQHAFLGASNYHWLNYSAEKLAAVYRNSLAKQKGTVLHAFAATCIKLGQKLPRSKKTINLYVNDAIGYKMTPEQVLFYSDNCFGTADAICFRDNMLRIHDLKTGESPTSMEQLKIYAALFCLEYRINPNKIDIELRIYQSDEAVFYVPENGEIEDVMKKIIESDRIISKIKEEEAA